MPRRSIAPLDHALRVFSGHAEGSLPHAEARLETLTELVARWTPEHLHDEPLRAELAHIRQARRRSSIACLQTRPACSRARLRFLVVPGYAGRIMSNRSSVRV